MQTEARVGVVMEGGGQIARHQRQQLQQPAHIGAVAHLISGGVAGAFSKTCTAPLSRLTILFQVQGMHSDAATLRKASIWHEASRIVYEEGFRAFWKGNLVTIAHRLPYSSISFYAYEQYKNLLQLITGLDKQRDSVSADVCVRLLGGGLAGLTAATMTYPLDLVRTRLSAQFHAAKLLEYLVCHRTATSSLDRRCFRKIVLAPLVSSSWITAPSCVPISYRCWSSSPSVFEAISLFLKWPSWCLENTSEGAGSFSDFHLLRDEGIRGLYKGLGATLLGVGPSLAINFCAYETLRSHWQVERPCDSPVLVSLASGSLAGIASSTVTFPLDLVRRRKQLEGAAGRAPAYKTGTFATFGHIIRTEGFRGLYRGILPEYYKVVPSVGIVFMTYETLKSIMS